MSKNKGIFMLLYGLWGAQENISLWDRLRWMWIVLVAYELYLKIT